MATLTVTLPNDSIVCNGKQITFRAPCACSGITGIIIGDTTYSLVDASNTCVDNIGNTFSNGAMISVILDTENSRAYIQNQKSATVNSDNKVLAELTSSSIVAVDADKTLALTDAGTLQLVSGGYTLTVPPNSSIAFPIGTEIEICQYGSSQVTMTAGTGVGIVSIGSSNKTLEQYAVICLKKLATDTWLLAGGLE